MDKEYAQRILNQTKHDYNLIAGRFSSTRNFIWEDLKPLLDYTNFKDKVLDAGCGNGRLYPALEEKKIDYYGIDNSEQLIKIAKEKYPQVGFQIADILKIPFADNYFDKIYCIAALHHIPSDELRLKTMEELKRVLKPNGLLILTVWNLWHRKTIWRQVYRNVIRKIMGKSQLDAKDILTPWKDQAGKVLAQRYIHAFTKVELKKLAERAGLKVKEIGITFRPELKDNNIYLIAGR
jgi:SAM-dependent methyltransferase